MEIYLKPFAHKEAITINESDIIELFFHRPKIDCSNAESLKKRIDEYFEREKSDCSVPTPEKLCCFIGTTNSEFRRWLTEDGERGVISRKALNDIIKEMNRASRSGRAQRDVCKFLIGNYKMWLGAYNGRTYK